jgi:hypothetical protein
LKVFKTIGAYFTGGNFSTVYLGLLGKYRYQLGDSLTVLSPHFEMLIAQSRILISDGQNRQFTSGASFAGTPSVGDFTYWAASVAGLNGA